MSNTLNELKQSIHNLRMRFPCGIRSVDDACDEKRKRLEALLEEHQAAIRKAKGER